MKDNQLFKQTIAPYSTKARKLLTQLRELVHNTAGDLSNLGEIKEELRWKQFSFLTEKSGSTIRIDGRRNEPDSVALYFHCQSGLVDEFKMHYANNLIFEGKRAIILDVKSKLPEPALKHCISLALTHHLRKFPANSRKAKSA